MDNLENVFAKADQERKARFEKMGLNDLDSTAVMSIDLHARMCISKEGITDEAEKRKIYDEVKRQYLEHYEVTLEITSAAAQEDDEKAKQAKEEEEEYRLGYEAGRTREQREEKYQASPFHR